MFSNILEILSSLCCFQDHRNVLVLGNMFLVWRHLYKWKSLDRIDMDGKFFGDQFFLKNLIRGRRHFSRSIGASISCSNGIGNDLYIPSNKEVTNAKLIYAVAPAMGHNQVYFS